MNASEPTRDQLLAMAYVDGELEASARVEFERRLASESALRREVSQLRELELLARAAAPKEPLDHEWEALAREPLQRGALGMGWTLALLGILGLGSYGLWCFLLAEEPLAVKVCTTAVVLGVVLLFGAVLRARMRTMPFDPYRRVQR